MIIDKIIAVEGLDKTGKSTFCNSFETIFTQMVGINNNKIKKFSFPNISTPIGKSIRAELASSNPDKNIVNTQN